MRDLHHHNRNAASHASLHARTTRFADPAVFHVANYGVRSLINAGKESRLDLTCGAPRQPLLSPAAFEELVLASCSDPSESLEEVIRIYRQQVNTREQERGACRSRRCACAAMSAQFAAFASSMVRLEHSGVGWGANEAIVFASALPLLSHLTSLDLSRNRLDDTAATALAAGVRPSRRVRNSPVGEECC